MRIIWSTKRGKRVGRSKEGRIKTFCKLSGLSTFSGLTMRMSGFPQLLVISQNIGGQLQVHMDWPSPLKNKGVFFVKREKVPLPEQISDLLSWMCCGDIHPNPLGIDRHSLTVASTSLFRSVLWDSGGGLQPNIQLLR